MGSSRRKLTYANVIATLALFLALGGGAYAAVTLPPNSVGAKQLKKGAVTPPKISQATETALKGEKGEKGDSGQPGAPGSPGADAVVAPQLIEKSTPGPGEVNTTSPKELIVECPTGHATGGGFVLYAPDESKQTKLRVVRSYALPGDKQWLVRAFAEEVGLSWQLSVSVICV